MMKSTTLTVTETRDQYFSFCINNVHIMTSMKRHGGYN